MTSCLLSLEATKAIGDVTNDELKLLLICLERKVGKLIAERKRLQQDFENRGNIFGRLMKQAHIR